MTAAVLLEPTGPYLLRRKVERLLPSAAATVERHLGERIPTTRVRLAAHPSGFGAAVVDAVNGGTWLRRMAVRADHRRAAAEGGSGLTIATEAGHVLVLLAVDAMRDDETAFPFAVHELVHAAQMGRPGVRADVLRFQRHDLGIERAPRRWVREYLAGIEQREAEAYRIQELATKESR